MYIKYIVFTLIQFFVVINVLSAQKAVEIMQPKIEFDIKLVY